MRLLTLASVAILVSIAEFIYVHFPTPVPDNPELTILASTPLTRGDCTPPPIGVDREIFKLRLTRSSVAHDLGICREP